MPARFAPFSRSTLLALIIAAVLFFQMAVVGGEAQALTTLTQEDNGEVVTTSISPTVYTTDHQIYTFVPSTPPTPTPSIVSHGSVMDIKDYISTVSTGGNPASATGIAPKQNFKQNATDDDWGNGAAGGLAVPGGWGLVGGLVGVVGVMARL